jgi:hypothetical protein
MNKSIPITMLFLDIGGVLLTDGWDHHALCWAGCTTTTTGSRREVNHGPELPSGCTFSASTGAGDGEYPLPAVDAGRLRPHHVRRSGGWGYDEY